MLASEDLVMLDQYQADLPDVPNLALDAMMGEVQMLL
jgi:hypothetical protein